MIPTKSLCSNSSTSVQSRMDANKVSLQQQLNQCSMQNGCQQSLFVATAQPVFNVEWMPTKSLCSNSSTSVQYRMDANKVSLQQCSTSVQCRMDANKVSLQQQLNQCSMQNGCQQSLFVATAQPVQNGCQQSLFVATAQPVFNVEWMPTKSLCSNSSTSVQYRMDANKVSLQQQLNQCSMQNGCQQSLFVATAQPVFNVEWSKSLYSNSSTSVQCRMVPTKSLCSNSSTSVQCRMDAYKVSLQQQLNQCSIQNGYQQSLFVATAQPMQNGCQQSLFVATAQPVFNVEWMPTKSLCSNSSTSVQCRMVPTKSLCSNSSTSVQCRMVPTKSLSSNISTSVQCRMDAYKVSLQQQLNQCSIQNGCQQSLFVATAQPVFNVEWMPTKSLCSNSSTSVQCRMDAYKVSLQQQLNQCSMQNGCQQSLFVATAQPVFNVEWMPTKSLCSNSSTSVQCRMDDNKSLCSNSSTSFQCRMDANKSLCSNSSTSVQCRMVPTKSLCSNSSTSFQCRMDANKSLCSNSSTSVQCRMDAYKVSLQQELNQCLMQNGCQQSLFVARAQPVFNAEWMPTKSLYSNRLTSV